jgi:hypothetical protein
MINKRERLLQFQVFVPRERTTTASNKGLLVVFFRKERLAFLRAGRLER